MAVNFHVKITGMKEALEPYLKNAVGTERIQRMRVAMRKVSNRVKYYIRREFAKHMRSGLLYKSLSYRTRYYRKTDTMVGVVGVKSDQTLVYKGRKQVSHKYVGFLVKGRRIAHQMLRQPPFHTRQPNMPKRYPRTSGPQSAKIDLQGAIDLHRAAILSAMIRAVSKYENR